MGFNAKRRRTPDYCGYMQVLQASNGRYWCPVCGRWQPACYYDELAASVPARTLAEFRRRTHPPIDPPGDLLPAPPTQTMVSPGVRSWRLAPLSHPLPSRIRNQPKAES